MRNKELNFDPYTTAEGWGGGRIEGHGGIEGWADIHGAGSGGIHDGGTKV